MAKTRTLPDKYYDKDYETNGIHRVPLWRIAGFALNNTATNLYLMFMNYVSFYLLGFVGVGMVMASSFTMRINCSGVIRVSTLFLDSIRMVAR